MYIRKEIRNLIEKMSKEMKKMPAHWKKFVNEQDIEFNLLIKHGKEYECTNCGKYSHSKQVEGKSDICPFCNNKYDVKRSNLKSYFFLYDLAIIDNIDNNLVLRYFEVRRGYNYKNRRFKDNIVEYARILPELNVELVNDRFFKCTYIEKVYHMKEIKKWRVFGGMNGLSQYYKAIYLENIDEKVKGTIYQYAPIKEAIIYLKNHKVDFLEILKKAKYHSFELLVKAGLYKLALDCPEEFNTKGNFEKRFGIEKEYYPFMQKHNISFDELCILRITKKKNIRSIRSILKMGSVVDIQKISTYVKIEQLQEYSKGQKKFSLPSYLDYIRNLQKLEVPIKGKRLLYPESFIKAHDEVTKKVEVVR